MKENTFNSRNKVLCIVLAFVVAVTMLSSTVMVAFAAQTKTQVLLPTAKNSGTSAIKLSWNEIDKATEYVVYAAKSGKKFTKVASTENTTAKVKKASGKKLTNHKEYTMYVVAYNEDKEIVKSKQIRFILGTTSGKYANITSLSVKSSKVSLSVGSTSKIKASYKIKKGKKHIKATDGKITRYYSDCPQVATVTAKGKITAKAAGNATIYVQDIGGLYKKVKVTVNSTKNTGKDTKTKKDSDKKYEIGVGPIDSLDDKSGDDSGSVVKPDPTTEKLSATAQGYADYCAMSETEKYNYYKSYSSPEAFMEWYNKARAAFEKENPTVVIGPGDVIDLG